VLTANAKIGGSWQPLNPSIYTVEQLKAGEHGCLEATVKAVLGLTQAAAIWQPFTELEIVDGGSVIWSGRLADNGLRGNEIESDLTFEGWQSHLDDHVIRRSYVHSRLTDWQDLRSGRYANLARLTTAGAVAVADTAIVVGFSDNSYVAANAAAGVWLDLGDRGAKRVVLNYEIPACVGTSGWDTVGQYVVRGTNELDVTTATDYQDIITLNTSHSDQAATTAATFTTPYRYVALLAINPTGTALTAVTQSAIKVIELAVYQQTAYESGNTSALTASDVITDIAANATYKLSESIAGIEATTYNITHLSAVSEARTPRELIETVNSYHEQPYRVNVFKELEFYSQPLNPKFEYSGSLAGVDWSTFVAAAGTYSQIRVEGKDSYGGALSYVYTDRELQQLLYTAVSAPAVSNPSFTTNLTGWTQVGSPTATFTRDTVVYRSSPASAKLTDTAWAASPFTVVTNLTGNAVRGRRYQARLYCKSSYSSNSWVTVRVVSGGGDIIEQVTELNTGWTEAACDFTVTSDTTVSLEVEFFTSASVGSGSPTFYLDDVAIYRLAGTPFTDNDFVREFVLKVDAVLTPAIAEQLAASYLRQYTFSRLSGVLTVSDPETLRAIGGGQASMTQVDNYPTQLVRLVGVTHPVTGEQGVDVLISEATYSNNVLTLTFGNNDRRFDALITRYINAAS